MTQRTTVVLDNELVAEARSVLGTTSIKDTIDAALHEVVRSDRRRRLVERFRTGAGMDMDALSEARDSWAQR